MNYTENEIETMYDEMLNDCYGDVEICGYTYPASLALYKTDPIAYRVGLAEFEASLCEDEA